MTRTEEIAQALALQPIRGAYTGSCPVCGYPGAFTIREKQGILLCYCHASHCSWDDIRESFQSKGLSSEKGHSKPMASNDGRKRASSSFHLALWAKSLLAKGTIVETYLKTRGVAMPLPGSIRYLPQALHKPSGSYFPVMLARVDRVGETQPVAIHRTFLMQDGSAKAKVTPNKMMLGKTQGGAVRLAEPTDTLAICEGIETGLSVLQATGIPTWAALSCGNMRNLILPDSVRTVMICADHDAPGIKAAEMAAQRWVQMGIRVRVSYPSQPGCDFNDVLRGA